MWDFETCETPLPFTIGPYERPNYEDWSCTAPSIVKKSLRAVAGLGLQRRKYTRIPY
jgi:hypothetical protein